MARLGAVPLLLAAVSCQQIAGFDQRELDATIECHEGECQCVAELSNCDGDLANGCEDTRSDPRHCGACGSHCGGECVSGECRPRMVMASPEMYGRYVVSDQYLIAANCDQVALAPLPTGEPIALAAESGCPTHVAVVDDTVFWGGYRALRRTSLLAEGTAPVEVVGGQSVIYDLAVADQLFWIDMNWDFNTAFLRRAKLDGSELETLVDLGSDFWGQLEIDDGKLYWSSEAPATVSVMPLDLSAAPTTVLHAPALAESFAVADGYVYWATYTEMLNRTPIGGDHDEPLASDVGLVTGLAVDDVHVYWTDIVHGTVSRVPLAGGAVEVVAQGQPEPTRVVLDDAHVYWQNLQGVVRMTK